MGRLTHERVSGIRLGYWSPAKKEDLVQRLGAYEDLCIDPYQVKRASSNGAAMRARLKRYWTDADEEAQDNLQTMTPEELFGAWLDWEGIIGYADTIIDRLRECGYIVEEVRA